jgi:hypothetical protein
LERKGLRERLYLQQTQMESGMTGVQGRVRKVVDGVFANNVR